MNTPVKSYARANQELVNSFARYLVPHGNSPATIRAYVDAARQLAEHLGPTSIVDVDRVRIRQLLTLWADKGIAPSSLNLRTSGLRSFFKFLRMTLLTKYDPMLIFAHRKLPTRLPRVLSIEDVERLIAAGENPFERTVVEVLYSTGVRVSELVNLKVEDIDWQSQSIRVVRGKGGKDRVVLFGSKAAVAMGEYLAWRPSRNGYLFETPVRTGRVFPHYRTWNAKFLVRRVQHTISIGKIRDLPSIEDARREFERLAQKIPGYKPRPAKPYSPMAIRLLLNRLTNRSSMEHVHPHALRRAMASHMLQRGANLRVVQDLLGHEKLNTTMRYTWLSVDHLRKVHENCHPKGDKANAKNK